MRGRSVPGTDAASARRVIRPFRATSLSVLTALVACAPISSAPEGDDADTRHDEMVALFGPGTEVDPSRTTHILLVGDSHKLGELPLHAALTRARKQLSVHPNDQVVLFITKDVTADDLAGTGAKLVTEQDLGGVELGDIQTLEATALVEALDKFDRIASIDFYGHSSPFGVLLETSTPDHTLNADTPYDLERLHDNFARDRNPYVTLNGCNGGAETAPELSALLEVPVAGALTGTMFQTIMNDGRWYFDDAAFYPAGLLRATKNLVSFAANWAQPACWKGSCTRMKPQDSPYRGVWADPIAGFQYGLSHYKFFCRYDDADGTCQKGMIESLYAWPSIHALTPDSSDAAVGDVLVDWFCSAAADATRYETCASGLRAAVQANTGYATMKSARDYTMECDMNGCDQQLRCASPNGYPQKGTCAWVDAACPDGALVSSAACKKKNTEKMTTVREWQAFMEGHHLLQEQ
jgi:hypothetical protein